VLTNGVCSHDDAAQVIRRLLRRSRAIDDGRPGPTGWSGPVGTRPARRIRRHLPAVLLMLPMVIGLLGAPVNTSVVHGDELSDAKAKQAALKKEVADQKARVAALADLQTGLAAEISDTKRQLRAVGADLDAVKKKITKMEARIEVVKADYAELVTQVEAMDLELERVTAEEAAKRKELADRRALLADRVRNAYDTDRTSPLETFISGGTFTDLLAEMSYHIDVGEQDRLLADQIAADKETLAALHQAVADTRRRTNELRLETAAQKRALDRSLRELKETKAELRNLEPTESGSRTTSPAPTASKTSVENKPPGSARGDVLTWYTRRITWRSALTSFRECSSSTTPSVFSIWWIFRMPGS
jgi:septal ring factor EnvC (AmiA/AmiB activator)